jgi:adenosylmethionine-8-amino-7-oxononanoate aminotransferase
VICGFGRTGEWFGSDYYDLKPDLMTIAKGLTSGYIPMGGVIVRDKVAQVLSEGGDFNHGFTYSGHPVAAAVGLENLRILRDEKIIEARARKRHRICKNVCVSCRTTRWWAKCAAWACSVRSSWSRTRPPAAVTKARAWA